MTIGRGTPFPVGESERWLARRNGGMFWPRHVLGSFQVGNYLRPERSAGSAARVSGGLQEADRGRI